MMAKRKKQSDFTARERLIREALFSVCYEKDWHLEFRPLEPETFNEEADLERWKFVDSVIDELRKTQRTNTDASSGTADQDQVERSAPHQTEPNFTDIEISEGSVYCGKCGAEFNPEKISG